MDDSKSKNTERSSLSNKSSCTEGVNPDQSGYEKAEEEAGHRAFEIERETGAELEECLKREKKESDNGEKKGKEKRDEKPCWPVISQEGAVARRPPQVLQRITVPGSLVLKRRRGSQLTDILWAAGY